VQADFQRKGAEKQRREGEPKVVGKKMGVRKLAVDEGV